jgi:hypothetical protein
LEDEDCFITDCPLSTSCKRSGSIEVAPRAAVPLSTRLRTFFCQLVYAGGSTTMPMYQTIIIFMFCLVVTGAFATFVKPLRDSLAGPLTWLALIAAASTSSAVSLLVSTTRHSGTGLATSYGWPKPFYFRYLSEIGHQSCGLDAIYFIGNSLAFSGALLIVWAVWKISRA